MASLSDRNLATRYARALLAVLTDPAEAEAAERFLTALHRAIDRSAELRAALNNPVVPRTARARLLRAIAEKQGMPARLQYFLQVVVDHRRTAVLPTIAEVYREERERAQGIVRAEITTALPLGSELEGRAQRAVERLTGSHVQLSCKVDPTLVGGATTRIGWTVYDGSVRTQLEQLHRRMAQE